MSIKLLVNTMVLGSCLFASAATAETIVLASGLPPKHFQSIQGSEALMECVTKGTNGEVTFNYFPSGELVKRDSMVTGINQGLAQIAVSSVPDEVAYIPLQGLLTLPGLTGSAVEAVVGWRKALDKNGVMAEEFTRQNVMPLLLSPLAPYQIMANEQLDDPSKWDGLKIRATGSSLSVLVNSIGGVAVQMPATEIYVALQRGTVDATILSFTSLVGYSLQEVLSYYSTNASFGTSASMWGMDLKYFNGLPADQQKVIKECGRSIELSMAALIDSNEKKIAKDLAAQGQVVFELTPEQLAMFAEQMVSVEADFLKRLNDRGLPAAEALSEYKAALGK
ncbi:TRAP transporter substrate-binding protein DctP [Sneathiella sp. HT1-7]|uniref:TRAP transporter substrate-binding protein DctP n=1 Tax=Sneathiella sp. HT1-7 TaxID=2887192 RepID=UPI001D151B75|nr:TRAP transporter substrate-binding protein DctP [Sneathiella sp. HT1-7]MCC3304341.1 TRAP transporter substrate-binding protein DctP [Sneathiella sp. HT1-7]